MVIKRIIPLFGLAILLFSSCGNKLQKDLRLLMNSRVLIPENLTVSFKGQDTLLRNEPLPVVKMIVWFDSLGCSSCQVQRMYEWNEILTFAKHAGDTFEVKWVFSPLKSEIQTLKTALRTSRFNHIVYIDEAGDFPRLNPPIPSDKRLHSFLLDGDNKVVLIGNPIGNEPLWALYKDRIRGLINAKE